MMMQRMTNYTSCFLTAFRMPSSPYL
jgi:hypothetical protein